MPTIPIPFARPAPAAADTSARPCLRDIDTQFRMVMTAGSREETERLVTAQLQAQAKRAMDVLPHDAADHGLLLDVLRTTNRILDGDRGLALDPDALCGVIESEIRAVALDLEAQRSELERAVAEARSRSSAGVSDTRIEADRHLKCGMDSAGYERDQHFEAAIRLLHGVARDVNGASDGTVWFEIGWLHWNHAENLPAAEDALTRALGLGGDLSPAFAEMARRHLAHIRYLRDDFEGAWDALSDAQAAAESILARFDRARCACLTGREEEARALALGCLRERTLLFVAILADEDFSRVDGHPESLTMAATISARDQGRKRLEMLGIVVQRIYKACERAGAPLAVPAVTYAERLRKLGSKLEAADILRCAPILEECQCVARDALDTARKSLNVRVAEQQRRERELRNLLKAAASRRGKDVQHADKSLAGSLQTAERSARAEARQTANWSLVLNLAVMGVVVGIITAMLAMKVSPDSARQDGGLLLALGLTFGVPAVVFAFAKYQNPGLDDWLRLAAEKEFAKEFPKKAEALKTVRDAAVIEADKRYGESCRETQERLDAVLAGMQSFNAALERIELLGTHAQL